MFRTAAMDAAGVCRVSPIGAEAEPAGGVHFRVWAPKARDPMLLIDETEQPLIAEPNGYFSTHVSWATAGARYGYRLDRRDTVMPDPASRFQPEGPSGLSSVIDPSSYTWRDADWKGVSLDRRVVIELHVGTFTPQGTYAAAAEKLPLLADLGITLIEMMPVAEFPGRFGWGYDGVLLFAPTRLYGTPDELRAFIDRAHGLGIGVILDVVYNHLGPADNHLPQFSDCYFTDRYPNEWGDALNFDGPDSAPVREFVCENAACWIREYHFDGLRLDATQQIFDSSSEHIVAEVTRRARQAAGERSIAVIAECETQEARLVRSPGLGGYGVDAIWNEDFHHAARVALTGRREAYYSDYAGSAQELLACAKHGFLYQGQRSNWQGKRRGTAALDLHPAGRVCYLENHDQVANSTGGKRLVDFTDRGRLRAATALLLLGPGVPMLFQGQEFASSRPFLYFADHEGELAAAVAKGRREFLLQFPSVASLELDAPHDPRTFRRCALDWSERERNGWAVALHRDLIALKRHDPVLSRHGSDGLDGAVLGDEAFLLRFFSVACGERLLIVNLGRDLSLRIAPEPLLAPPPGASWRMLWSSEDAAYGGDGARQPEAEDGCWHIQGHAAVLLTSEAGMET